MHSHVSRIGAALAAVTLMTTAGCMHTANSKEVRLSGEAAMALSASDYSRALERAEQATRTDPTDPWPYYDRGTALVALGRTSEALVSFERSEGLFGPNRWGRSISIFARARAYKLAGRCSEAARSFEQYAVLVQATDVRSAALARRYADDCAPPVEDLQQAERSGNAAMALAASDRDLALIWANRANAAGPNDPWPFYDRGSVLISLGRTDEAISSFERAEALFRDHPWGRWISVLGRARAYMLGGRCADATAILERYASMVPRIDSDSIALARRNAVECANPRAISAQAPASTQATQALISGDDARAVELADQEAIGAPNDGWPYYHRAAALVGLGRTDEALANFERAEALFADNPWARSISIFGRARAYLLARRCADAARSFEEYARFVEAQDQQGATLARRYARECRLNRGAIGGGRVD
jgi:tetratricopeptide (TPR) repeat protein